MKQTRTAIKELTAAYRAVLKHAAIVAAGVIVSVGAASAEITMGDIIDNASLDKVAMPLEADYTYTAQNGEDTAITATGDTVDKTGFAFTQRSGAWDNVDGPDATTGNITDTLDDYTFTSHGETYTNNTKTTIDESKYTFTDGDGADTDVATAKGDFETKTGIFSQAHYEYEKADGNNASVADGEPQMESYTVAGGGTLNTYVQTDSEGKVVLDEDNNPTIIVPGANATLVGAVNAAYQAYMADVDSYDAALTKYNNTFNNYDNAVKEVNADQKVLDAMVAAYNADTKALSDLNTEYNRVNSEWQTAYNDAADYAGSLSEAIDTKVAKSNADKQDALDEAQLAAVNSGVDAAKVEAYDAHVADADIHVTAADKATWTAKQDALDEAQLAAVNSGVDAAKVSAYDTHVADADVHVTAADKATWTAKQDALDEDQLAAVNSGVTAATVAQVSTNAENISANADKIAANAGKISVNEGKIAANAAAITAEATARAEGDALTLASANSYADERDAFTLSQAKAYADAQNHLALESAYNYTDHKINSLEKEVSAGIASATALSSVAVSDVKKGEVSVGGGYGYYNSQSAIALGAAMGLSDNWSVNAGAGLSDGNVAFRAGTNYKFKLF